MEPDPVAPGTASKAEQNQEPHSRQAAARQELENSAAEKIAEPDGTMEVPAGRRRELRRSAEEEPSRRGSREEVEEISVAR